MPKDKILRRNNTNQKNFDYNLDGTSLKFTLRTDIKSELKNFLEILKVAVEDVTIELDKQNG